MIDPVTALGVATTAFNAIKTGSKQGEMSRVWHGPIKMKGE